MPMAMEVTVTAATTTTTTTLAATGESVTGQRQRSGREHECRERGQQGFLVQHCRLRFFFLVGDHRPSDDQEIRQAVGGAM